MMKIKSIKNFEFSFNKVTGSTLMVTGTCVGVGMLVIPIITAPVGIVMALLLLTAASTIMYIAGNLLATITADFPKTSNILTIARYNLGNIPYLLCWFLYLIFLTVISASYINITSEFIRNLIKLNIFTYDAMFNIDKIITSTMIFIALQKNTLWIDFLNRVCTTIFIISLIMLTILIIPFAKLPNIYFFNYDINLILKILPTLVLSFGFHHLIPSINNYLDNNLTIIKKSIKSGLTIVFLIYSLWIISMFSLLSIEQLSNIPEDSNDFIFIISDFIISNFLNTTNKIYTQLITSLFLIFALFATISSHIGVAFGLRDFLVDGLKNIWPKNNMLQFHITSNIITCMLPLLGLWLYPSGFIKILTIAAQLAIIILIILPGIICIAHKKNSLSFYQKYFQAPCIISIGITLLLF